MAQLKRARSWTLPAAFILDYTSVADNYFIKVQGSNTFTNFAFYFGNNGNGFYGFLSSPFDSAHVTATVLGQDATLTIDPTRGA